MARKDEQRWRDQRSSGGKPLHPAPKCRNCEAEFWVLVPRQELCHQCAWDEVAAHRAPVTADEAERERLDRKLKAALEADAQHKPIPLAEAPTDYAKLSRRAENLASRLRNAPRPASPQRKGRGGSSPSEWLPLARRKERSGWSHRKIGDFLGISRKEVGYWLSLHDGDADRFLAACEGKLTPGNKALSGDPRLLWCYSKYESQCRQCKGTIFVGDRMVHLDERWIHAKCAAELGHEVVELDRRSRVQVKLDRRKQVAA